MNQQQVPIKTLLCNFCPKCDGCGALEFKNLMLKNYERKDWQIDNQDRFIKSLKKEVITRSILTGLASLVIGIIVGMNL